MRLGKIKETDLEELAILYEELMEEKTNLERMKEAYQKMSEDSSYFVVGAWNDKNELVGSVYTRICQDLVGECRNFLVVENVIVKHTARRQGIGKSLLEFVEKYAKDHDCEYSMLVSGSARKEAHELYIKAGYDATVRGFRKIY